MKITLTPKDGKPRIYLEVKSVLPSPPGSEATLVKQLQASQFLLPYRIVISE